MVVHEDRIRETKQVPVIEADPRALPFERVEHFSMLVEDIGVLYFFVSQRLRIAEHPLDCVVGGIFAVFGCRRLCRFAHIFGPRHDVGIAVPACRYGRSATIQLGLIFLKII